MNRLSWLFVILLNVLFYPFVLADEGFIVNPNTSEQIWINAKIDSVEKGLINAVWKEGGSDKTPRGDKVIWGYFHANPADVSWGNVENPDLFVKIWFDSSGRTDVNFFHVSVPDIDVFSELGNVRAAEKNKSTMDYRYIRHFYNSNRSTGFNSPLVEKIPPTNAGSLAPAPYDVINQLRIGAFIETQEKGNINAVWRLGGVGRTERGDEVVWGYFYASPNDVSWGSINNPDLYVKIWFDASGRVDVNFFHVSVPNIRVFSGFRGYEKESMVTLNGRYSQHEYQKSALPTGNTPPVASPISLKVDPSIPYQSINLIGHDADGDVLNYELTAPYSGTGYQNAFVDPSAGILYLTLESGFSGRFIIPYRVTDGKIFSQLADIEIIVESQSTQRSLGLIPEEPDKYALVGNARGHGAVSGSPGAEPSLPRRIDLSGNFPEPGSQGKQNSCAAWATAYALKTYQEKMEEGWELTQNNRLFSPAFIYNQINGGEDKGSYILDALELIVSKGAATLATMPYDQNNYTRQPSTRALEEASFFKAESVGRVETILDIKKALTNRQPVVVGISVYPPFETLSGSNSVYNSAGNEQYGGGHAVTIVGYDDDRYGGAFKVINSWGTGWGDKGYFWLPYAFARSSYPTGRGLYPILNESLVLKDKDNTRKIDPSPIIPTPVASLPNLQVETWSATYDAKPGGAGKLTYSIKNTGTAVAKAGADVNLMLSKDDVISSNDIYVVYETIPFDLQIGGAAVREDNNTIPFYFPTDLESGLYYMAVWVDDTDVVQESNERDNISLGTNPVDIVSALPDLEIENWYATWDSKSGNGSLEYKVNNRGDAATKSTEWDINLVLSSDETIGNGNEYFLFFEPTEHIILPKHILYRDENSRASFNIYKDVNGNSVPDGVYYMALWVDDLNLEEEADEENNYSVGGSLVRISSLSRLDSGKDVHIWESYNGLPLPSQVNQAVIPQNKQPSLRQVQISKSVSGQYSLRMLSDNETARFNKRNDSADSVIFPTAETKPMPSYENATIRQK